VEHPAAHLPAARRATPDDAPELTRLRGVLHASMGRTGGVEWRPEAERRFRVWLVEGPDTQAVAYVVPAPDGAGLASCAVALIEPRLPGPFGAGPDAHLSSVATDPRWRRRGLARAAVTALVEHLDALGVRRITLNASDDGESLYRSLGFVDPANRPLVRRRPT
jgi:ribosomal protein S18 acetylase RimI-like enzyme